ncbi:hypothetical protein PFDG_04381 [Plasmodium falciparum Dd2]|uniref:Uncharacterized protein n=1 Tax=Plasmodium falciparum (isolate Dd2) TaxID=57267 RepID=A0A0L7M4X4_PLAF4|nr:hypothetical protein PFDG_04381 [Plasmodium falciparum Dd2]
MASGKGKENISTKDTRNDEDNTNKKYFVDVIKRLNKNDNKKYYLDEENKTEIQDAETKFKNELNEEIYNKDDYIIYDDGNPEIQFFTNKQKLKIARYSWKAENPKAYVFALHGITSHLRNEYLNYYGRPIWAHKKDEVHDNNISSDDNNNIPSDDNNNIPSGDNNNIPSGDNNSNNNNNNNNNANNDYKPRLDKYTNELKESEKNNNDYIIKDNLTNTINYGYHRGNVGEDINNDIEKTHERGKSIEVKSEVNIPKYTSTSSLNKVNGNNNIECENLRKNSLKSRESYFMNNEPEKSVLNEGDVYESTSSLSCSSSELMDKKTLEKKLTMFLSCSSCMSNYNENTNGLNNDKKFETGSDNEMNSDDNMMVDDDNVLLIDENYNSSNSNNNSKNNKNNNKNINNDSNNNNNYDGCNDNTVYYCSMCGSVCNYCNCGERTLSYKNSWIEN